MCVLYLRCDNCVSDKLSRNDGSFEFELVEERGSLARGKVQKEGERRCSGVNYDTRRA